MTNNSVVSAIQLAFANSESSPDVIESMSREISIRKYRKGEFILLNDQEVSSVIGINRGLAKMYLMDHLGNEFTFKLLLPGDIIGYRQIIENEKFNGYLKAMKETEVCLLSKSTFLKLLENDLPLNKRIIERLSADIKLAKDVIENLSLKDARNRICALLIKLQKQFGSSESNEIVAELTRDDFAKLVGVARESLSRCLSDLAAEKIILLENKKIKILDYHRLAKLAMN